MITLTQTESTLSLSANIRPKGYEGAEFVPEGLTVEVVGRNNGALLQHLKGNIEGDRLSVDIDLDDVQDVDIYDLVINYRLRDARYVRGYRAVNIIETAFEARRSENTSILGGGNTARATVITPVASEGANAGGACRCAGQALDINALLRAEIDSNAFEPALSQDESYMLFMSGGSFSPNLGTALYNIATEFGWLGSNFNQLSQRVVYLEAEVAELKQKCNGGLPLTGDYSDSPKVKPVDEVIVKPAVPVKEVSETITVVNPDEQFFGMSSEEEKIQEPDGVIKADN